MLMNYSQTLVEQFNFVILLATLTTLVPYAYAAAAEMHLFVSERERFSGHNLARDLVVAVLAFAYAIYAIVGAGTDVIAKGFILLMLGVPVYVYLKWREHGGQVAASATSGPRPTKRAMPEPIAH